MQNLTDPDLKRLGTVVTSRHPQFGAVAQIGLLVRLATARASPARHAPLPGEHTEEILAELGLPGQQIRELHERKIVR